jgi:hypothetical protein
MRFGRAYDHNVECTGCGAKQSLPGSPVLDADARALADQFAAQHAKCSDTPRGQTMRFPLVFGYKQNVLAEP